MLLRHPEEEVRQLLALARAERGTQGVLVLARDAPYLVEHGAASLGEVQAVGAPAAARVLHLAAFATGGAGHVVPLGLLVAGVAVTSGLARLLPMWMMACGLVLAAIAELSTLSLVVPALSVLLPLARFPALAWLIAAGALLPRSRAEVRDPRRAPSPGSWRPVSTEAP